MNPLPSSRRPRRPRRALRGFTLVELMVVVMIVSILAIIGVMLFRKYVSSSKSVEALSMIQSIRAAEERWRSENQTYLDVSTSMTSWYPMKTPGKMLYGWDQSSGNDYQKWRLLGPTVAGPVQFGYVVKAGPPFTTPPKLDITDPPVWPQMQQPWYVIMAKADADGDGVFAKYAASSLSDEIYRENEGE